MKVLLTGFEPFGNLTTNASWEAVKRVSERLGESIEVDKLLLPVEYGRAAERCLARIAEITPDAVLSVGVATSRKAMTPEYLAINVRNSRSSDNAGKVCLGEPVIDEGESVLYTNFPYAEMLASLASVGAAVEASFDAGTYVCNELFYRVMYHIRFAEKKPLGGFLHIPPESVIDSGTVAKAIEAFLLMLDARG